MKPEEQKIKELKVGEIYNVRVKVNTIGEAYIGVTPILQGAVLSPYWPTSFALGESSAFSPITPENGTKNTAPAPKYDPCRLFKKGDRVRVVEYKGRNKTGVSTGEIGLIDKDEKGADVTVEVIFYGDDLWEVDPAYLELVTPVEEMEPYSIDPKNTNVLFKYGKKIATFEDDDEAQELCDRLNAEHRKEQK